MTDTRPHDLAGCRHRDGWAALPAGALLKFAAAKLERFERERTRSDFEYACYGENHMDPDVVSMVEALRDLGSRLQEAQQ